jgi:voltage-gated potassium channel
VCGIALVGIVTASLATWLLERVQAGEHETQADVAALAAEIRELHQRIGQLIPGEEPGGR